MHTNLAISPVIHGTPAEPVSILYAAEHFFDLLLARVAGDHFLSGPVHAIGEQHSAAQSIGEQALQPAAVKVELHLKVVVPLFQLIVNQLRHEGIGKPALDLIADTGFGEARLWLG